MFALPCLRVGVSVLAVALDVAVLATLVALRERTVAERVYDCVTSLARVTALVAPSCLANLAAAALVTRPLLELGAVAPCRRTAETAEATEGGRPAKRRHRAEGRGTTKVTEVRREHGRLNRVPSPRRALLTGEFVGAEELADGR